MKITIEHFPGERPQFNVSLATSEGKEPFLTIKGCRIVDGSKGQFVSWPAKKLESGKYWNHVYASESFNAAVLAEAAKSAPRKEPPKRPTGGQRLADMDDDIPF